MLPSCWREFNAHTHSARELGIFTLRVLMLADTHVFFSYASANRGHFHRNAEIKAEMKENMKWMLLRHQKGALEAAMTSFQSGNKNERNFQKLVDKSL